MELKSIFEGKDDLRYQEEARELAHAIGRWVIEHNAEVPIKDLFSKRSLRDGVAYLKNVRSMGIEGYDDLNFGFVEGGAADAFMATGTDERRPAYFVFVKIPDAGEKIDAMYSIRWPHLIHELTHYIDRKRSATRLTKPHASGEDYYNSPMEFNAYFHQGLYELTFRFRKRVPDNFPEFLHQAQIEFDENWRAHMTDDTRRRFLRRLYGVWKSLIANTEAVDTSYHQQASA